ncbi:MAG TPA: hypothetical protein VH189_16465 [Rhizomicrobium sp.]|nr:hypothetical protein [Rhizomicrobium sp.]
MTDFPQASSEQRALSAKAGARRPEEIPQAVPEDVEVPRSEIVPGNEGGETPADNGNRPLFPSHQCTTLENEWQAIQANFVDSPRNSVEQADALVKKTIDTLAASFSEMRGSLERTWEKNGEVSTEELRMAMQNYRSFFRRLLSI